MVVKSKLVSIVTVQIYLDALSGQSAPHMVEGDEGLFKPKW